MAKILIYAHNVLGLGHVRTASRLAHTIAARGTHTVLVVTGSGAIQFPAPGAGWDLIKLPTLTKLGSAFESILGIPSEEALRIRARILSATVASYKPDVLVVDHSPRGLRGELADALALAARSARTILLLRDILNAPSLTRESWHRKGYPAFVSDTYDLIVHMGEERIFNAAAEYDYPARLRNKLLYLGYDLPPAPLSPRNRGLGTLVTIGGGRIGTELLDAAFTEGTLLPKPVLLLVGPLTPVSTRVALVNRAEGREDIAVIGPLAEITPLLDRVSMVVHNGSYNTTCETLARGIGANVLPRSGAGDQECSIRAERLAAEGVIAKVQSLLDVRLCEPRSQALRWGGRERLATVVEHVAAGEEGHAVRETFAI